MLGRPVVGVVCIPAARVELIVGPKVWTALGARPVVGVRLGISSARNKGDHL